MREEEIIKYKKDCDLLEMTDKEIIDEAKATLIDAMDRKSDGFRKVEKVALVAIETILDLYNKEKEKNKEAIKYIKETAPIEAGTHEGKMMYDYNLNADEISGLLDLLEEDNK